MGTRYDGFLFVRVNDQAGIIDIFGRKKAVGTRIWEYQAHRVRGDGTGGGSQLVFYFSHISLVWAQ